MRRKRRKAHSSLVTGSLCTRPAPAGSGARLKGSSVAQTIGTGTIALAPGTRLHGAALHL